MRLKCLIHFRSAANQFIIIGILQKDYKFSIINILKNKLTHSINYQSTAAWRNDKTWDSMEKEKYPYKYRTRTWNVQKKTL